MANKNNNVKTLAPLLMCAFIVAIASIVYELIIAGISSYLLGNSVYQFSITIGLFMTAMGLGSFFSKYMEKQLMVKFLIIEILLALIGGSSAFFLFYSYAVLKIYVPIMFLLIIVIGFFTGFELPLLTRIIRRYGELKDVLANTTAADYIGGLVGSVVFPIILLPSLGFIKTCYIIGILNILVAAYLLNKYHLSIKNTRILGILIALVFLILVTGVFTVQDTEAYLERKLYRDNIVYSEQSKYQKIVITKDSSDIRLFLNGNIQFSSKDEYRYHEALVHPALSMLKDRSDVLVLGGGDGLAVREILKYSDVGRIDLVDLDEVITKLARTSKYLLDYNQDSLNNRKVHIYNQDAYQFLEHSRDKYDVILVDLPDPNNESLNKLYTVNFYHLIYLHLKDNGMMVAQSTSPYFAPECFWIINNTISAAGFYTRPYHVYVPSFGDWGFNLGIKNHDFNLDFIDLQIETKYLSNEIVKSMFVFGEDILEERTTGVNSLIKPILIRAYYQAWDEYN